MMYPTTDAAVIGNRLLHVERFAASENDVRTPRRAAFANADAGGRVRTLPAH